MPPPLHMPHGHGPQTNPVCPKCGRRIAAPDAPCIYCSGQGWKILRRLVGLLAPFRGLVAAMIAVSALGVAVGLVPPYLTKRIIDDVILSDAGGRLRVLAAITASMVALAALRGILNYLGGLVSAKVGAGVVLNLRNRLHDALLHSELKFFGARNSGEYTGRIMNDTEDVQRFLVDGSRDLVVQGLSMIGIAGVLLWMNWRLALIVFAPAPLLVWISNRFHRRIHAVFHDQGAGIARLNTGISETIGGIRTIKAFSSQDRRAAIFGREAKSVADIRIDLTRRFMVFFGETGALMDAATAIVWFAAAFATLRGAGLTLGDITAFAGYTTLFYGPIRWLTNIVNHAVNALVASERIFFVIDAPREDAAGGALLPRDMAGHVQIKAARFAYEPGKDVLKGLDLDIAPGEMVGLVGRSGVGKSTLVNLICRFFRLDAGEILIDGHNVNDLDLAAYRRRIGMVLQDTFLFNASVFDNIACARPGASAEEVEAAARAASAHDFIAALPDGYRTTIGEGGARLSGGERQRIAIARAILHNPPILILDEATSSVDTETERKIRDALAALCKGRTVIAIAHRLSTLRNANRLAVIDDGRVAELGSHAELLAKGGLYARLVAAQTELNEIGADHWNP
ncbi:MAG: ABC transporter ATP-binding protein [Kiritimatiellae bacterium]|nr:ABC transporter ATP-binding protein [Kiritimatiellia bacterium]